MISYDDENTIRIMQSANEIRKKQGNKLLYGKVCHFSVIRITKH